MADDVYQFIIAARDTASATVARTSKELRALGGSGTAAAGPLSRLSTVTGGLVSPTTLALGAVAGLTAGLSQAVENAKADEQSQRLLAAAIKSNVPAWDGNTDAIERTITARQELGFVDEDQRASLRQLVAQTKDVTTALDLQRTAMDLARLRGIDLRTASVLLGKVYGGNIGILARYGIQLEKGTTATEAIAEVQRRTAGQAEAWAAGVEGQQAALGIAWDEMIEQIGYDVLPAVKALVTFIREDILPAFQELIDAAEQVGAFIGGIADAAHSADDALIDLHDHILATSHVEIDPGEWAKAIHEWVAGLPGALFPAQQATVDAIHGMKTTVTSFDPGAELGIMWGRVPRQIANQEKAIYAATHKTLRDPTAQAAFEARQAAMRQFEQLPKDISDAVTNNLPDLNDGLDSLRDMIKHSLSDTEKEAKLRGILTSKALARGLHDERFDVRAAARELQQNAREELRELESGAKDAAADGGKAYARFLRAQRGEARNAGRDVRVAATEGLQLDADWLGRQAGESYAAGLQAAGPAVGKAANLLRIIAEENIDFHGSPKFSHARALGAMVAKNYGEGLSDGIGAIRTPRLPASLGPLALSGALALPAAVPAAGSGSINISFSSLVPYTPAQGQELARRIGPELARWLRQNA